MNRKYLAAGAFAFAGWMPLPSQCAPAPVDDPPSVASTAIICDTSRCDESDQVTFSVWGGDGWVEGEMACKTSPSVAWYVTAKAGPIWFGGGGTSLRPTGSIIIKCPHYAPHYVPRTASAWGWNE